MARTGVTYFDIVQAADEVKNRGEEPTVDRVRAELGTGSKSTIGPLLKRWRSETGNSVADTGGLPKDLVDALKALHERLQGEADQRIEQANAEHESTIEKLQQELVQARELVAGRTQELRNLEQNFAASRAHAETLTRELQVSQASLAQSEYQREASDARVAELKSTIEELKQENRDIRAHFEYFQQRTADDRQQERDQFRAANEQLSGQVARFSQQLSDAGHKLAEREAAGEQLREAIASLNADKQELTQQVSVYYREIELLRQSGADQSSQISALADEARLLQDRMSALQSSNASLGKETELLRQSLGRAQSELDSARERVALLSEENRTIQQEKALLEGQFRQLERASSENAG